MQKVTYREHACLKESKEFFLAASKPREFQATIDDGQKLVSLFWHAEYRAELSLGDDWDWEKFVKIVGNKDMRFFLRKC